MEDKIQIEKTLKNLKIKIEKAKEDLAEAKGQKKALLNTLKKEFNTDNILEAQEQVKKLAKNLDLLENDIDKNYKELKEKFNI